jgi:hypothetical protein
LSHRPILPMSDEQLQIFRGISFKIQINIALTSTDRDGSVRMTTRCGLDVPRIKSQPGRDFPHQSRPYLGPTQPPVKWEQIYFPGSQAAGQLLWPTISSSPEVKEVKVQFYFHCSSVFSWSVLGWNFHLPYLLFTSSIPRYEWNIQIKINLSWDCTSWRDYTETHCSLTSKSKEWKVL